MNDINSIKLIGGILITQIIVKILKKYFKIQRPIKTKTYGFPSSRAAVITFIVSFIILTNKLQQKTKIIIISIAAISIILKMFLKEHYFDQLFVGSIIGFIIAYLFSKNL